MRMARPHLLLFVCLQEKYFWQVIETDAIAVSVKCSKRFRIGRMGGKFNYFHVVFDLYMLFDGGGMWEGLSSDETHLRHVLITFVG